MRSEKILTEQGYCSIITVESELNRDVKQGNYFWSLTEENLRAPRRNMILVGAGRFPSRWESFGRDITEDLMEIRR